MSSLKRTIRLGYQPIPRFAREGTLVQVMNCWDQAPESFPAADSRFNIACLAFFPRQKLLSPSPYLGLGTVSNQPVSTTFWSNQTSTGVRNLYNVSRVAIPQGAEYWAVSWLQPPDSYLDVDNSDGPFPEDFFRVVWSLGT